jgi:uncharacterized protein (TIGR03435 family)
MKDAELLRDYVSRNSEEAFRELVDRHMDFVYATALRQVRDSHLAKDVVQAVFIVLAKKAHQLPDATIMEGWLFRATRYAGFKALRDEQRQHRWIREAAYMETPHYEPSSDEVWKQIAPVLNDTLNQLREADRDALLLRFFKGKSFSAVGEGLGISEDAAKKRVSRGLDKLRILLGRRGIVFPATILAATLSANAVQAAPVGLSSSIAAVAVAKGTAATNSTLTLTKGVLKLMAWTKAKTAIVAGAGILLAAGTTTVAFKQVMAGKNNDSWRIEHISSRTVAGLTPRVTILPTKFSHPGNLTGGGNGKFVGIGRPVTDIVQIAYDWLPSRILFADANPSERYDFITTVSHDPLEALQAELKKQLGLSAHVETREMDVLQLRTRTANAPGLKPPAQGGDFFMNRNGAMCRIKIDDRPISVKGGPGHGAGLTTFLEAIFGAPVVDHTSLAGNYSIDLKWTEPSGQAANHDSLKRALADELGLELVAGHESIDVLMVEKSK